MSWLASEERNIKQENSGTAAAFLFFAGYLWRDHGRMQWASNPSLRKNMETSPSADGLISVFWKSKSKFIQDETEIKNRMQINNAGGLIYWKLPGSVSGQLPGPRLQCGWEIVIKPDYDILWPLNFLNSCSFFSLFYPKTLVG